MVVHQGFNDIANRSLKFLLAVGAYEPYLLVVACRYFTGRAIVLVTPHGSGHRALGSQIIDTRNNLATCANRATCTAILYGMNYIADRSFKLLLTIGAYEPRFLVAACRYFAGGVCVLCTPHSENLRTLGSQIIDTRNNLAIWKARASNSCLQSGHTNHAFLLLPTDTSLGVYVFLELHIAEILGHLVAKSLTPEMTFLELIVLVFMVNSLSPRIFEACNK
jgi:hypothetical protein